ncbi:MAG TPA: hypothetical protein EYH58_00225 [Aquifex aeolicus]|nr:hypothetical protein [Aquifex aeolicus]
MFGKKYEEKIIELEILSGKTAVPVHELWYKLYENTGKEIYLDFARKIEKGIEKWKVYASYVSDEVLLVMKTAEEKGLPLGTLLEEVKRIKDELKKVRETVKSKVFLPLVYYVIVTLVLGFVIGKLTDFFFQFSQSLPSEYSEKIKLVSLLKNLFFPVNLLVFSLMLLAFVFFPHRTPVIKKVFKEVDGLFVIALSVVFYSAQVPLEGIIKFFRGVSGHVNKIFSKISDFSEKGFSKAISEFLPPEESVIVEISVKTGMFEDTLRGLYSFKKEKLQKLSDRFGTTIFILSFLFLLVPFSFFLTIYGYGMMVVVQGVMEILSQY